MKQTRMMKVATACTFLMVFSTPSHAELHSRLDGAAAYDDVLNITWLTDAGLSGSNGWTQQLDWVAGLNSSNYLGFSDWRLASMSVASGVPTGTASAIFDCEDVWEPLCRDNELSYMFYHNLGGTLGSAIVGDQTVGDVTLFNIQPIYWSGTESGVTNAWMIHFDSGFSIWSPKNGNRHGWAVRAGDVLATDSDGDGIDDSADNCLLSANPDQYDSNGDGYGNRCDADLDNNGIVNFVDLGLFSAAFGTAGPDADLDGNGVVNFLDFAIFAQQFGSAPGPSGIAP